MLTLPIPSRALMDLSFGARLNVSLLSEHFSTGTDTLWHSDKQLYARQYHEGLVPWLCLESQPELCLEFRNAEALLASLRTSECNRVHSDGCELYHDGSDS